MSSGYSAAYADCIEEDTIKKFCPKEFEIFNGCVQGGEVDMEEFARKMEFDDRGDYDKDLLKSYDNLCKAFKKNTGLELGIAFHDSDEQGDCYDEISGIYFYVNGMYQLTPAGKKMSKYVMRQTFVQFG